MAHPGHVGGGEGVGQGDILPCGVGVLKDPDKGSNGFGQGLSYSRGLLSVPA